MGVEGSKPEPPQQRATSPSPLPRDSSPPLPSLVQREMDEDDKADRSAPSEGKARKKKRRTSKRDSDDKEGSISAPREGGGIGGRREETGDLSSPLLAEVEGAEAKRLRKEGRRARRRAKKAREARGEAGGDGNNEGAGRAEVVNLVTPEEPAGTGDVAAPDVLKAGAHELSGPEGDGRDWASVSSATSKMVKLERPSGHRWGNENAEPSDNILHHTPPGHVGTASHGHVIRPERSGSKRSLELAEDPISDDQVDVPSSVLPSRQRKSRSQDGRRDGKRQRRGSSSAAEQVEDTESSGDPMQLEEVVEDTQGDQAEETREKAGPSLKIPSLDVPWSDGADEQLRARDEAEDEVARDERQSDDGASLVACNPSSDEEDALNEDLFSNASDRLGPDSEKESFNKAADDGDDESSLTNRSSKTAAKLPVPAVLKKAAGVQDGDVGVADGADGAEEDGTGRVENNGEEKGEESDAGSEVANNSADREAGNKGRKSRATASSARSGSKRRPKVPYFERQATEKDEEREGRSTEQVVHDPPPSAADSPRDAVANPRPTPRPRRADHERPRTVARTVARSSRAATQTDRPKSHAVSVSSASKANDDAADSPGDKEDSFAAPQPTGRYRSGRLTNAEKKQVLRALDNFREMHKLEEGELVDLIHQNPQRAGQDSLCRPLWALVETACPSRRRQKLIIWSREKKHNFVARGTWTEEQDDELQRLIEIHGKKWTVIGELLNRYHKDIRDRYRNYLVCRDSRAQSKWSPDEVSRLQTAVAQSLQRIQRIRAVGARDDMSGKSNEELINWNVVSEEMGRTRGRLQCQEKWKQLRAHDDIGEACSGLLPSSDHWRIERARKELRNMTDWDKYQLVNAIRNSGVGQDSKIKWKTVGKSIDSGRYQHAALSVQWARLKQTVEGWKTKTTRDCAQALCNMYEDEGRFGALDDELVDEAEEQRLVEMATPASRRSRGAKSKEKAPSSSSAAAAAAATPETPSGPGRAEPSRRSDVRQKKMLSREKIAPGDSDTSSEEDEGGAAPGPSATQPRSPLPEADDDEPGHDSADGSIDLGTGAGPATSTAQANEANQAARAAASDPYALNGSPENKRPASSARHYGKFRHKYRFSTSSLSAFAGGGGGGGGGGYRKRGREAAESPEISVEAFISKKARTEAVSRKRARKDGEEEEEIAESDTGKTSASHGGGDGGRGHGSRVTSALSSDTSEDDLEDIPGHGGPAERV